MPRAARCASSTDDSCEMASGVAVRDRSSGTPARSASAIVSGGGVAPPVTRRHGSSWLNTRRNAAARSSAFKVSRYRTSLVPNTRTRPGRRYASNPDSARPVFCVCGMVTRRSSPAAPASSSRSRTPDSDTSRRIVATLTPRGSAVSVIAAMLRESARHRIRGGRRALLRLDQSEIAVFTPVQDADGVGLGIAEHHECFALAVDAERCVLERHRLDRISCGPDDARRGRSLATGGPDHTRRRRALACVPLPLQRLRLLLHSLARLSNGDRPCVAFSITAQHMVALGVHGDFRAKAVLLLRQGDDRGNSGVVEESLETGKPLGYQLPDRRGDLHVPASYVESHISKSFQLPASSFQFPASSLTGNWGLETGNSS